MKDLKVVLVFLAATVLTCCSAKLAKNYEDEVDRGDAYVDQLLREMIAERGHEYDPYYMDDSVVGFHRKIGFFNVSGQAKFHNGYITGLRSLHRAEHCSLQEHDDKLSVKADMAAGILDFHYSGSVLFMNWGPTVTVHGELAYVEVDMTFDVDKKTGKDGQLKEFYIDDMRGMKVWVTGLGPLNWAVNPIISGLSKIFKGYVKNMIETKIEKHIAERLPNYRFPVEGLQEGTEEPQTKPPVVATEEPQTKPPVVATEEHQTMPPVVAIEEPQTKTPVVSTEEPQTKPPVVATEEPQTKPPVVATEEPQTKPPVVATEEPQTKPPVVATEEPQTKPPVVATEEPQTKPPVMATEEPQTKPPVVATEEPQTKPPIVATEEPQTKPPVVATEEPQSEPTVATEEPQTIPTVVTEESPTMGGDRGLGGFF